MKIACLNDLPIAGATNAGFGSGAELSMGAFIREGIQRGHYVDVITPEYADPRTFPDYDLLVTKGLTKFNDQQLKAIMSQDYIAWPSDYAWTRWRLYFGFQPYMRQKSNLGFWTKFFTNSLFNVFLSPLHKDCHDWVMPETKDHPHHLSPPAVNEEEFHPNDDGWEPGTAVCINGLLPFKGHGNIINFCEQHPNLHMYCIGGIQDGLQDRLPSNMEYVGRLPQQELTDLLGRIDIGVELPGTPQPFNRTSIELLLSCKQVITNSLVGATSYDWYGDREKTRAAVREAPAPFWDRIEKEAS